MPSNSALQRTCCAYIGVGSSIDPETNIQKALRLMRKCAPIQAVSTFYRSAAIDRPSDPAFVNGVVRIATVLGPVELKRRVLTRIEDDLGRVRGEDKYAPRTIDLDILLYENLALVRDDLRIPDPGIHERPFLAMPLCELDPKLILPDTGESIRRIAARLRDLSMEPLPELTEKLRREVLV